MKVQPQCVEAKDGFPRRNATMFLKADNALQVSRGVKPIWVTDGKSASKAQAKYTDLMSVEHNPHDKEEAGAILCRKETESWAKAYGGLTKWFEEHPDLDGMIYHIVAGMLLGYRKEDIRAWCFTGVLCRFYFAKYYENRKKIVTDPFAVVLRDQYFKEFEKAFASATQIKSEIVSFYSS